jgi:Tfp pilus assembly protein PilF
MIKKSKLAILSLIVMVAAGLFSSGLFAQNKQDYNMNNIKAEHYIKISREQIDADNLLLAKVYAQKAVRANPWSAKAWANYDDIIQKIADNGEVEDFETFIERSEAASGPAASDGGSKFEGC